MGKGEWSLSPWGLRGWAKIIEINANLKDLLYSLTSNSQTVCMIVINIEPTTKIVKFMAQGLGALMLGRGFNDFIVKMQ